jgi:acyl-CoA hydrolase
MAYIDDIASISASRHARTEVVTASTDSVDFLYPISQTDSVCLASYVTWTGTSSMEVFVKVVSEDLKTGNRKIAATAFLTFVALDDEGKTVPVPQIIPETEEEKKLFETAPMRAELRRRHRTESKSMASHLTIDKFWDLEIY